MGFLKHICKLGLGVAAVAVAVKVMEDYNTKTLEGEYVEVPGSEEETDEQFEEEPKEEQSEDEQTAKVQEAPAEKEPCAEQPAPKPAPDGTFGYDIPNANPVTAPAATAPVDETGKLDPTRIASPEDFGNWEDLGCQG